MASKGKQRQRVFVVGVGMTNFEKPGKREWDYPDMAREAVTQALADAGIPYEAVEQACVGYVYGDSTCGQRAVYEVGLTGIPIYNVNNNCSTGSTALYMAKQFVEGGLSDCVLALGFEKMERGSLKNKYEDRTNPMEKHAMVMAEIRGFGPAPVAPQLFGNAGREHMEKYGTKKEHFAKIAEKNHRHSAANPRSQFRDVYTLEQILASRAVHEPLTMLQCCPTSEGAAAALVVSERFVYKYGLQKQAVEIVAMAMGTDTPSTFEERSSMKLVGYDMTKRAAERVYAESGLAPSDVQVIELHDCFSANELITYEALGLCPPGKAGELIDRGDNTYGGKWVVNPSGGLISKGHPLGATGLAQCAELVWQLRGQAGERQVKGAKVALQHNLGLGGAVVVGLYRLAKFDAPSPHVVDGGKVDSVGKPAAAAAAAAPKAAAAPAPKPAPAAAAPAAAAPAAAAAGGGKFSSDAVFGELKKRVSAEVVKKVGVVYRFDVSAGGATKHWLVDLKNGAGAVEPTSADKAADCTLILSDGDFVQLMSGKLNAQQAFMKGQLKIKGNMMAAQKLSAIVGQNSKM